LACDPEALACDPEALACDPDALACDPDALAWMERERERAARAAAAAASPYSNPNNAKLAAMLARTTEARQAEDAPAAADAAVLVSPPATARNAPAAAAAVLPRSREEHLTARVTRDKRELAGLQLEARIAKRAAAKAARRAAFADESAVWGPAREKRVIEARAKQRPLMEQRRNAEARFRELAKDPRTAHHAIAIKKLCDENEWTFADVVARRLLTIVEFFLELARPHCWNAHRARAPLARGLGAFGDVLARGKRKYSLCVTAIAQPFLATVLAGPGDTPTDDRRVCRKTVGRLTALLEDAGVLRAEQVPAHAAESHEVGPSGWTIYRYWLADKGSPKPALMALWPWDADGELRDAQTLEAPWRGARVVQSTAPP
jgi:hypothetical protein